MRIGNIEISDKRFKDITFKSAKKACVILGDGWRLPTKEELNLMWLNRESTGGFAAASYWSSSCYNNNFAWFQHFYNGLQNFDFKLTTNYVRAVRSLSI
jgi:hypothetical protein